MNSNFSCSLLSDEQCLDFVSSTSLQSFSSPIDVENPAFKGSAGRIEVVQIANNVTKSKPVFSVFKVLPDRIALNASIAGNKKSGKNELAAKRESSMNLKNFEFSETVEKAVPLDIDIPTQDLIADCVEEKQIIFLEGTSKIPKKKIITDMFQKAGETVGSNEDIYHSYQRMVGSEDELVLPSNGKYLLTIVTIILLFAAFFCIVFWSSANNTVEKEQSDLMVDYGIVIDAGSNGSRLHLFCWPSRLYNLSNTFTDSVTLPTEIFQIDTRPPLSHFVADLNEIHKHLKFLIDNVIKFLNKHQIKKSRWSTFPIFLKATAGMRELTAEARTTVMTVVRDHLSNKTFNPFMFRKEWARVISGEEESVYGWLAVNSAMGTIFESAQSTYGSLDLGGSSAQISFSPVHTSIMEDFNAIHLNNTMIRLYAHSFLGYGWVDALMRLTTTLGLEMVLNNLNENKYLEVEMNSFKESLMEKGGNKDSDYVNDNISYDNSSYNTKNEIDTIINNTFENRSDNYAIIKNVYSANNNLYKSDDSIENKNVFDNYVDLTKRNVFTHNNNSNCYKTQEKFKERTEKTNCTKTQKTNFSVFPSYKPNKNTKLILLKASHPCFPYGYSVNFTMPSLFFPEGRFYIDVDRYALLNYTKIINLPKHLVIKLNNLLHPSTHYEFHHANMNNYINEYYNERGKKLEKRNSVFYSNLNDSDLSNQLNNDNFDDYFYDIHTYSNKHKSHNKNEIKKNFNNKTDVHHKDLYSTFPLFSSFNFFSFFSFFSKFFQKNFNGKDTKTINKKKTGKSFNQTKLTEDMKREIRNKSRRKYKKKKKIQFVIEFSGSSDFKTCYRRAKYLFYDVPCFIHKCSFNGVYQPRLGNSKFIALGQLSKILKALNITHEGASIEDFRRAAEKVCHSDYKALKQNAKNKLYKYFNTKRVSLLCWKSLWSYAILHDGYGFPSSSTEVLYKVNEGNEQPGWVSGSILYEINFFARKTALQNISAYSTSLIWCLGFISILLIISLTLFIQVILLRKKIHTLS